MKKSVLFSFILVIFLLASLSGVLAAENFSESKMIDNAYTCLNHQIGNKTCEKMTTEELIFSTMATGECQAQLKDKAQKSNDELECWPKDGCDVKTTSQAMMALNLDDKESEIIIDWLNTKRIVPKDMEWFLQIDTENATTCKITYEGNSYNTEILENKKFTNSAGSCLNPTDSGFWLQIQPNCLEKEFEVSCDKRFISSLLFKELGSNTIQVSKETNSEPDGGTSIEKINSFCFSKGISCDYEGTLWATASLGKLDYNLLPFVPYLITAKETNKNIFSQPLLYILTKYDEYKLDIIDRQVNDEYWLSENGKYFATAMALFPFFNTEFTEKTNAIKWLNTVQNKEGCWDEGNIVSNGFLLSSISPNDWGKNGDGGGRGQVTPDNDCISLGYYCDTFIGHRDSPLEGYSCRGASQRCYENNPNEEKSCSKIGGEICQSSERCSISTVSSSDGECCVAATCDIIPDKPQTINECEDAGGSCAQSCSSGEYEDNFYLDSCVDSGSVCCLPEQKKSNYIWLWILFVLIILVVIAIIYKDKIKEQIIKMKSKKKDGDEPDNKNRFNSRTNQYGQRPRRIIPNIQRPGAQRPRRIIPNIQRPGAQRPVQPRRPTSQQRQSLNERPRQKTPEELNDVLRKLKDMSK